MRAKVVAYYGYSYVAKDSGELREGRLIDVVFSRSFGEDDGKGNFSYGSNTRTIRLSDTICVEYTHEDLKSLVGQEVMLDFAVPPGKKYEVLVELEPV